MINNFTSEASADLVAYHRKMMEGFRTPIETPRLIIQPWPREDSELFAEFCNADELAFKHRMEWNFDWDIDADYVSDTLYDYFQENLPLSGQFQLLVYLRDRSRIIGEMIFHQDKEGRDRLSYFILPSERRKGYGREAHAACIDWARRGHLANQFHAQVSPTNVASEKLLKQNGFVETGGEYHSKHGWSKALDLRFLPLTPGN